MKPAIHKSVQVAWFKRPQRDGSFHYYEVFGSGKKTPKHLRAAMLACRLDCGYQVVVNFLNEFPIISVEHNYVTDPSGLTGTWCTFEVGEAISQQEYRENFERAIAHPKCSIR